ncbi:putative cytochrome P450 [Streptomyces sp. NBRC 110611]|uniref:cytochrome P450 n=1 Tax=Streptomyces sp. NBRC 110611 TaxID=1621259 RepID=UPI000832A151|nr:cytochrome P450 [Streptomyces sp. NBRC 110611]GAU65954.1 putative cytochrome P450 [Streptomyces sp. NBRC 110611]
MPKSPPPPSAWTNRRAPDRPFDPPPERARLIEEAPVSRVTLWNGSTAWLVARHADQVALLRDRRISADDTRPSYPAVSAAEDATRDHNRTFISMDEPEHTARRRKFMGEFTERRLVALRPRIERIVDGLLDAMAEAGPPADLVAAFAMAVPVKVICELLGVPYEDREFFQEANAVVVDTRSTPEAALDASRALTEYLGGLVERKLHAPGDDLLSRLAVDYLAVGRTTREECAREARLLLAAGQETTTSMIALGTCVLLLHPDQMAVVRDGNREQVGAAVEELLRYLSVTHLGRRRVAVADITLHGHVIKAGDAVICANDLANRDPEAYEDPDRLDVRRSRTRRHLTFGHGPHQCLGQHLARLELQVAYPALFRRFPGLRPDRPLSELSFITEKFVYGLQELPVDW